MRRSFPAQHSSAVVILLAAVGELAAAGGAAWAGPPLDVSESALTLSIKHADGSPELLKSGIMAVS